MLLEDDAVLQWSTQAILKLAGFSVLAASRAEDGIALLNAMERPPTATLVGLKLLRSQKAILARRFRSDPALWNMPIVVWTASSSSNDSSLAGQVIAWLQKPVEPDRLVQILQSVCGPETRRQLAAAAPPAWLAAQAKEARKAAEVTAQLIELAQARCERARALRATAQALQDSLREMRDARLRSRRPLDELRPGA